MGQRFARFGFRLWALLVAVAAAALVLTGVRHLLGRWEREDRRQLESVDRKLAAGWQALLGRRQEKEQRARRWAALQSIIAEARRQNAELRREIEESQRRNEELSRLREQSQQQEKRAEPIPMPTPDRSLRRRQRVS